MVLLGVAGPPTCDSGCVATVQDRPAQDPDRSQVAPAEDKRRIRQPVDYIYPPPLDNKQRGPRRGDFWSRDELDRAFGRPAFEW